MRINLRVALERGLKSRQKLEHEVGACLRAGDIEGAAHRVVNSFGPGVQGYLRVALTEERMARDVFALFSESVWSGIRRWRGTPALEVWVYRLAYQCAKQSREGSGGKRSSKQRTGVRDLDETRAATLEPFGPVEDAELLRRELTLEEQTLLTLRIDRDFGWTDIAGVLGRTSRVKSGEPMRRRYERLVERLHRIAIARGVIAPGPMPASARAFGTLRRSATRDA